MDPMLNGLALVSLIGLGCTVVGATAICAVMPLVWIVGLIDGPTGGRLGSSDRPGRVTGAPEGSHGGQHGRAAA